MAATLEASFPADSVRIARETSSPFKITPSTVNSTCIEDASSAASISLSKPFPARFTKRPVKRYKAPESRILNFICSASSLATVPLPAPLGPSMVITGTALTQPTPLNRLKRLTRQSQGMMCSHWRNHQSRYHLSRAMLPWQTTSQYGDNHDCPPSHRQ